MGHQAAFGQAGGFTFAVQFGGGLLPSFSSSVCSSRKEVKPIVNDSGGICQGKHKGGENEWGLGNPDVKFSVCKLLLGAAHNELA